MNRRLFLQATLIAGASLIFTRKLFAAEKRGTTMIEKINKSEKQWREALTAEQFHVLRREGTEAAFSSPLNKEYHEGSYLCAGCALPLFVSANKFDSGTGWPSFSMPIEGHTETKRDFRMILPRTEYHCARCGGHQGHVFNDGPQPSGQRWCNNGLALQFKPA
ncbi:MAG: peptide-methionine (R)-S-oxide reductase MsrB [Mariprofundus sp.]|nr:peptide-methionine (R)-S-oxide reductase MsrB [Mariprofundus sp.]